MRLAHPNVVRVRDYGDHAGNLYLVMDLIVGRELQAFVQQVEPPPAVRIAIVLQLLAALDYVYGQEIIHCDIKPANILVRADEQIVLTDFGVARIAGSELTRTDLLIGSPSYMAPEQIQGRSIDFHADLFAVGIILYSMLTGQRPFMGETRVALMYQVVHEEPPPPAALVPELSAALDAVVMRALAKDPDWRFGSAAEFAAALSKAWEQAVPAAVPVTARLSEDAAAAAEATVCASVENL